MSTAERVRVEAKCDDLVTCRLWPPDSRLRFRAWLNNFEGGAEELAAVKLLDHFVFLDQQYAELAIKSAYVRYLADAVTDTVGAPSAPSSLLDHHRQVHVTIVRGESPNPSDSGYTYARVARHRLNINEDRIIGLREAITLAAQNTPILLIDDFCGTGQQVYNTLARTCDRTSLLQTIVDCPTVVCMTALMTSYARAFLSDRAPKLRLFPCHTVDTSVYSVEALLPRQQHPDVYALLSKYSDQLRTPPYVDPELGFEQLGLLFGINDSIPDASLPILWAPGPSGWNPLMERSA